MTNHHKIFLTLGLTVAIFIVSFSAVSAIDITNKVVNVGTAAGFSSDKPNLAQTIGQVIRGFLSLLGLVFMGYLIYAGQLWMTARGNEEQISKAKAIIRGSIIGLVIVFSAYAIATYVINTAIIATNYNPAVST